MIPVDLMNAALERNPVYKTYRALSGDADMPLRNGMGTSYRRTSLTVNHSVSALINKNRKYKKNDSLFR